MSKEPETFGEDESPTPLSTLGDVQRAMAKTIRRIEAGKTLDHATGQVLINGLGALAKVMQDRRDSLWTKRGEVLWKERADRANAQPQENH